MTNSMLMTMFSVPRRKWCVFSCVHIRFTDVEFLYGQPAHVANGTPTALTS